jgi:hypothetical protein
MKCNKEEYSNRIEYRNERGYLHRTDGPAIEYHDGTKSWYINGKLYREDGPAIVWNDGTREWYLYGKYYTEDEWKQEVAKIKLKRILDL